MPTTNMTTKQYLQTLLNKVQLRKIESVNPNKDAVLDELEIIEKEIQALIIQDISEPEDFYNETKLRTNFLDIANVFKLQNERFDKIETQSFNTRVMVGMLCVCLPLFLLLTFYYLFLK